jgi:hypothetical protein
MACSALKAAWDIIVGELVVVCVVVCVVVFLVVYCGVLVGYHKGAKCKDWLRVVMCACDGKCEESARPFTL